MAQLDEKDLVIMQALDKFGRNIAKNKITKQELEELLKDKLKISDRAIRYRIFKLKEKNILKKSVITTHERKLGLGDYLILLNVNLEKEKKLLKLFKVIPYLYLYSSTYGKFKGYLLRFVYSLKNPEMPYQLLDILKKSGYLLDYKVLDVLDYQIKSYDFNYYNPEDGWIWDWEEWYAQIEETLKEPKNSFQFNYEQIKEIAEFDIKDLVILKNLIFDSSLTLKELKKNLDLSEAQISKRIKRLEDEQIIRGYYFDFNLMDDENFVEFYCFIDLKKPNDNLISIFYQIPYSFIILIESSTKLCFHMKLSATDFKKFLKGFDFIRTYLDSYFLQFIYDEDKKDPYYIYDLFNQITNDWEIPIEDYISLID
ncbi:MAG: winged helix-turn-helix transcriptional regulator [Promethearchaeota archaeon]